MRAHAPAPLPGAHLAPEDVGHLGHRARVLDAQRAGGYDALQVRQRRVEVQINRQRTPARAHNRNRPGEAAATTSWSDPQACPQRRTHVLSSALSAPTTHGSRPRKAPSVTCTTQRAEARTRPRGGRRLPLYRTLYLSSRRRVQHVGWRSRMSRMSRSCGDGSAARNSESLISPLFTPSSLCHTPSAAARG